MNEIEEIVKEFQKNLVVWKLSLSLSPVLLRRSVSEELSSVETYYIIIKKEKKRDKFQKNLVVWKPSARARNGKRKIQVSEELSSVETSMEEQVVINFSWKGFRRT